MDPVSNQLPPYKPDEIELWALQRPPVQIHETQVEVRLLKPYEVMSSPQSRKGASKKDPKQKDQKHPKK